MWTWPLDSALRATAAHRAPKRVADGTCTQVWAWMTNKCRRRMNQGEGYIILEISQKKGGGGGEKVLGKQEELGIHIHGRGVLSPWGIGPSNSVFLASIWSSAIPKQAVTPSEPNFWTQSLQIHCNGSAGPRSHPSLGPVRTLWPYNWRHLWGSCSCDDECNGLLRQDQVPYGRLWWPVYCTTKGELLGGSKLNGPLAPYAWPPPPPGVRPPWI